MAGRGCGWEFGRMTRTVWGAEVGEGPTLGVCCWCAIYWDCRIDCQQGVVRWLEPVCGSRFLCPCLTPHNACPPAPAANDSLPPPQPSPARAATWMGTSQSRTNGGPGQECTTTKGGRLQWRRARSVRFMVTSDDCCSSLMYSRPCVAQLLLLAPAVQRSAFLRNHSAQLDEALYFTARRLT